MLTGQVPQKVVQHGADGVVLVREPASAPRVARSRSARQRRSRKKPRRSGAPAAGRAVDLQVRVARQGRELCGGLAPVAQQALLGPTQRRFPSARLSLDSTDWVARWRCHKAFLAKRAMHLGHLYSMQPPVLVGVAPRVSPCLLTSVDQAVVAAVQEKQHGVPDDAHAARGALLEDAVVLQSVRPQGLLPHEDEDLHPPGVAELEGLDVVEAHGAVRRQAGEVHPRVGQSGLPAGGRDPRRPASSG